MASAEGELGVAIVPLGKEHDRSKFSCGSEALDVYLRERVGQDARKGVAAPFVLADSSNYIIGYYTLSAFSIVLDELPDAVISKLPKYPNVPATLLGRLAVDQNDRGRGLGEYLLMDALHRSWRASTELASYAVVVDAKDARAAAFYRSYEFQEFPDQRSRLFMPMNKIQGLFK